MLDQTAETLAERYVLATVAGETIRVVNPAFFYAAACSRPERGLGLFCRIDLLPGDCWWAHDFTDPRYVRQVIPWPDYERMSDDQKREAERLCYVDVATRCLIACAEPFCRVNHSFREANSCTDARGCSIVTRPIPAGEEITIPYDYDPIISILWKFPELRDRFAVEARGNASLLWSPVEASPAIRDFLAGL